MQSFAQEVVENTTSGSTDTGSIETHSGGEILISTESGTTDSGSTDTGTILDIQTGSTDSGSTTGETNMENTGTTELTNSGEIMTFNAASETINIASGYVMLPNFRIVTDMGVLSIS